MKMVKSAHSVKGSSIIVLNLNPDLDPHQHLMGSTLQHFMKIGWFLHNPAKKQTNTDVNKPQYHKNCRFQITHKDNKKHFDVF